MAKSIELSANEWKTLRRRLKEEYKWKPSIFMIREVMRRELGFTTRMHSTWDQQRGRLEYIYLDFFDDNLETLFRLKYL